MSELAALALEMRRMNEELASLRQEVAYQSRRQLKTADRRTAAALLPLLRELLGEAYFTSAQVAHAAFNSRTPAGRAVLELIAEDLVEDDRLNAFGKMLGRIEGVRFGDLRLERAGEAGHVTRWRVGVCRA